MNSVAKTSLSHRPNQVHWSCDHDAVCWMTVGFFESDADVSFVLLSFLLCDDLHGVKLHVSAVAHLI
jgi:hypothetical protein